MSIPTQDSFSTSAGTAHFNVLSPGHSQARKAAYSVRHIAYGNLNVVQLGGRLQAERKFTVYVPNETELSAIDACLGQQGTLTYAKGSFTAALVEYDARGWWDGDQGKVELAFLTDAD